MIALLLNDMRLKEIKVSDDTDTCCHHRRKGVATKLMSTFFVFRLFCLVVLITYIEATEPVSAQLASAVPSALINSNRMVC